MWRVAGEQEQVRGGAEVAEDGSQRVHGARTEPLSLSRTHVSLDSPAQAGKVQRYFIIRGKSSEWY